MDSLEEEMSRFEQEVLGATSFRPPPLMGATARPLMSTNVPRPLLGPPSQTSNATRPLLPQASLSSTGPKPLMPATQSGFIPRQALKSGPPPVPLMGGPNGPPGMPPLVPQGPPRMHTAEPSGPPPGMPPPGPPSFPPPRMGPPPGQRLPIPPPPIHHPPPQLQPYTPSVQAPSGSATPLNPMAIAQAVAGATASSGMSASHVMGASLLPVPPMPPKKGLVGKVKSDPKKLRVGGGKVWEDCSLDDWDQNDFRIFVGDLGNDVNDDTLARSFSRFPSFLKAKVIRDKYSKKTKGYGFVSFKDPKDFMNAMREMNGRYIGNRPVKLRKSTWKDRQLLVVKKKEKEKKRLGFK